GNTAPITVYDNGHRNQIGISTASYWNDTEPDKVLIYRIDPKQQYLIRGSVQGEVIQGSVYNNLIIPGGGADTITAGLGNNEIQDPTETLNGITVTDFHLGDRFNFTNLGLAGTTASYAGGKLHVFSNAAEVAAITMPAPKPGEGIVVAN